MGARRPPTTPPSRRPPTRTGPDSAAARPALGRPPLSPEAVRERVAAYCERYGVRPDADGLPPFPSGRRETVQHREWLTVYRAVRRLAARATPGVAPRPAISRETSSPCPICGKPLPPSARETRLGTRAAPRVRLHEPCAALVERLRAVGFEAANRALRLLWAPKTAE